MLPDGSVGDVHRGSPSQRCTRSTNMRGRAGTLQPLRERGRSGSLPRVETVPFVQTAHEEGAVTRRERSASLQPPVRKDGRAVGVHVAM